MRVLLPVVAVFAWSSAAAAEPGDLPIDVHGFVSMGWFHTWDNAYLAADSESGSTELWEAAISVTSRPIDRLRLGVQLFARDLGVYDNGRPVLDYAYADWRATDWLGAQAGRVRIPVGLGQEEIDNDTARTQVFLPWSVYPLRVRDFFLAVDGAKLYGFVPLTGGQSFEYTVYGGTSSVDTEGGFATSLSRIGYGTINELDPGLTLGGMLHWNAPGGLAMRGSLWHTGSLQVGGQRGAAATGADIEQYWWTIASLSWESEDLTLAAEYSRSHYGGEARLNPASPAVKAAMNADGGYFSATWQVSRWCELYGAIEIARSAIADETFGETRAVVGAIAFRPARNWSLKVEWREMDGPIGFISSIDNPDGVDEQWRMVAFKTTADF